MAGQALASERALQAAVSAVNEPTIGPEPDFVFWVDSLEVDLMTGRCLAELRRPRAVPVLEEALTRYDDTHALYLAAGVGSVRPGERLRGVLQRLLRFGGPEVSAVLERARS